MDRIRSETIEIKTGMEKDVLKEIEEQQLRWFGQSCKQRTAELLNRLQNGTHKRKGGMEDQSAHGIMGLRTVCTKEASRMKNVLIKSSERYQFCLWVEENCIFTEKSLY
jgi:hypothetical protein